MRSSSPFINIKESLEGIDFPATKEEIVAYATEHDADENALEMLRELPEKVFDSLQEISEAFTSPEEEEDTKSKHSDPIHKKTGGVHTAEIFPSS